MTTPVFNPAQSCPSLRLIAWSPATVTECCEEHEEEAVLLANGSRGALAPRGAATKASMWLRAAMKAVMVAPGSLADRDL